MSLFSLEGLRAEVALTNHQCYAFRVNRCGIPLTICVVLSSTKASLNWSSSSEQLISLITIVFALSSCNSLAGCADQWSPSQYH